MIDAVHPRHASSAPATLLPIGAAADAAPAHEGSAKTTGPSFARALQRAGHVLHTMTPHAMPEAPTQRARPRDADAHTDAAEPGLAAAVQTLGGIADQPLVGIHLGAVAAPLIDAAPVPAAGPAPAQVPNAPDARTLRAADRAPGRIGIPSTGAPAATATGSDMAAAAPPATTPNMADRGAKTAGVAAGRSRPDDSTTGPQAARASSAVESEPATTPPVARAAASAGAAALASAGTSAALGRAAPAAVARASAPTAAPTAAPTVAHTVAHTAAHAVAPNRAGDAAAMQPHPHTLPHPLAKVATPTAAGVRAPGVSTPGRTGPSDDRDAAAAEAPSAGLRTAAAADEAAVPLTEAAADQWPTARSDAPAQAPTQPVTERAATIGRIRNLARAVSQAYFDSRVRAGFPLSPPAQLAGLGIDLKALQAALTERAPA